MSALSRPFRLLAIILLAIVLTVLPLSPVFAASLHSQSAKPVPVLTSDSADDGQPVLLAKGGGGGGGGGG
ncbi:MAG TPA: hypothetical protein VKH83_16270, partial [Methylomirabilota bacterium]|nr:hypothetical protein [Methylomirabilota bacterium]